MDGEVGHLLIIYLDAVELARCWQIALAPMPPRPVSWVWGLLVSMAFIYLLYGLSHLSACLHFKETM
jgi:hypothetical protein